MSGSWVIIGCVALSPLRNERVSGWLVGVASLLLLASALHAGASARTLYVSPAGSDESDGTSPNKAWQTIRRVNKASLLPGDSVLFEGGRRFSGSLLLTTSGAATAFITIGSYGNGMAAIEAANSYGIRLQDCQYVKVCELTLRGAGVTSEGATSSTAPGLDIFSTVSAGPVWQCIYIDRLHVSGFREGVTLRTPLGTQSVIGYNDVRVQNCTITECQWSGFHCWGSQKIGGLTLPLGKGVFTNCHIGGCTISNIYGAGKDSPGRTYEDGAMVFPLTICNASSCLVERNTVHDCGQSGSKNGYGVAAVGLVESDHIVVQFNECYGTTTNHPYDGIAFDIDGGCSDCIVQSNYSHDNDGGGFYIGDFPGSSHAPTDNTIRYNISQNDVRISSEYGGGLMCGGYAIRGQAYNNTVFSGQSLKPPAFRGQCGGNKPYSGLEVRNNIFVVAHDGPIAVSGNNVLQNNCYYRTKGGFLATDRNGGPQYDSLAAWQKATHQEMLDGAPVGFNVNPQLKAPGTGGNVDDAYRLGTLSAYDLLPSSPLGAGRGLNLTSLFGINLGACDFRGTPLPPGDQTGLGAVTRIPDHVQ